MRRDITRFRTLRFAIFVWLAAGAAAHAAPPQGKPLMILLRPEALAMAVGANGFVVGGTFFQAGAFHWMPTGGVVEMGGLETADVSQDGKTFVGTAFDLSGRTMQAAVWTGGRSWRLLGSVGAQRPCDLNLSSSFGTNDDGRVVVGLAWDGCSHARAFRWEESTGMTDLGSLSGNSSRANGVSGDGRVVVGWEEHATGFRQAAKWLDGREELIRPGALLGEARATNRDGSLILGSGCEPERTVGPPAGWTWTASAGIRCFPVPTPSWAIDRPYQVLMQATSDDGRVMGGALSFGLDSESVVWFDGELVYLRDYLRSHGVPDAFEGWYNTGFVTDVSADGRTLVGYGAGPTAFQGWIVILPELGDR
jgi:probable HAF family extracellular repeat protein